MKNNLKLPFNKSNEIENYYSQAGQDIFVLCVLDGMTGGRFLDIGCNEPKSISNSYLLESHFGWNGILIDMNIDMIDLCKKERTSKCVCGDATSIDYSSLLKGENFPNVIDYVSVDIDGIASFRALQKIPLLDYKVREHLNMTLIKAIIKQKNYQGNIWKTWDILDCVPM
jgi:hypothetical protein